MSPEKALLVCTATESQVASALEILREKLSSGARVDLLSSPANLSFYASLAGDRRCYVFPRRSERFAAWKLLQQLRSEKYEVVAVLWSLHDAPLAAKIWPLFCAGRRILVFNENLDCDFLSISFLRRFLAYRLRSPGLGERSWAGPLLRFLGQGYWGMLRLLLFPLRLLCLLVAVGALFLFNPKKNRLRTKQGDSSSFR